MRILGLLSCLSAIALSACGGSNESGGEVSNDTATQALKYHCVATGTGPQGPDLWLELEGTKAKLSHKSTFTKVSSGTLDTTYKPTLRVNTARFRGFTSWTPGGTTTLYIYKGLQSEGGEGDIFVDTVTTKFTEFVFACDPVVPTTVSSSGSGAGTCASAGYSGSVATFDLDGQPGGEASVAATSTAPGVTSTALSRAAAITPKSATGSIDSGGWGTGESADPTRYYTFKVTPPAGCNLTLDSLALDVEASSTGPKSGDVATSADGFDGHSSSFAGTSTPLTPLTASGSGAIEVRVYGYGASSSAGTFRIRNTVTLSGSLK